MERKSKNTWTNQKGITLIALVITIVVLLILAGVSLNAVVGNNGIVNRAQEASKETDVAETREQILMGLVGIYAGSGDYTNDDVIEAVKNVVGDDTAIEVGQATVTTAKGNEVDISDLWVKIKITISQFPEAAETSCALLEVVSVEGLTIVTTQEEYNALEQRILEMDESSKKELIKRLEIACCNYYTGTSFTTFEEVLQYEYEQGWISTATEEAFFSEIQYSNEDIMACIGNLFYDSETGTLRVFTVINPDGETSNSYIATENGTYTFTVIDILTGKTYIQSVEVTNIDINLKYYIDNIDNYTVALKDKTTGEPIAFSKAYMVYNGETIDITSAIFVPENTTYSLIDGEEVRTITYNLGMKEWGGSTYYFLLYEETCGLIGRLYVLGLVSTLMKSKFNVTCDGSMYMPEQMKNHCYSVNT